MLTNVHKSREEQACTSARSSLADRLYQDVLYSERYSQPILSQFSGATGLEVPSLVNHRPRTCHQHSCLGEDGVIRCKLTANTVA